MPGVLVIERLLWMSSTNVRDKALKSRCACCLICLSNEQHADHTEDVRVHSASSRFGRGCHLVVTVARLLKLVQSCGSCTVWHAAVERGVNADFFPWGRGCWQRVEWGCFSRVMDSGSLTGVTPFDVFLDVVTHGGPPIGSFH